MRKVAIASVLLFLITPFTVAHGAPQVVYLAYQGPLTGVEAPLGLDQSDAVEWAIKNFNSTQSEYEVKLFRADDKGDPAVAAPLSSVVAAKSEILGIIGPAYSGAVMTSLPAYKAAGLAMISPSATRDALTDPSSSSYGGPVFFRLATLNTQIAQITAQYAMKGISNPRVFILDDQSSYSASSLSTVKTFVQNTPGAQLAGSDSIADSTTEFNGLISKLRSSGSNVIVYYGYQNVAVKVLKAIRGAGIETLFTGSDGIFLADFPSLAGSASRGVKIVSNPSLADASPVIESKYRSVMGKPSGIFAIQSIDAANVFLQGIKFGNTTRTSMLRWVKSYKNYGLTGSSIEFSSYGDVIDHVLAGYIVENQKIVFKELLGNNSAAPLPSPSAAPSQSQSSSKPVNAIPIVTPTAEPIKDSIDKNAFAPPSPINAKYSISGNSIYLTATAPTKIGAKAKGAYLIAPLIGISKTNRIIGEISNGKATFSLDVNGAMAGKLIRVSIYLTNEIGESEPLRTDLKVPATNSKPQAKKVATSVACQKGNLLRIFTAKTCPSGWKKT